ncbi:tail protein X [Alysiella crassa]|uniref:Phage Tail Protein X n=1 Tax=Alysiella crassa TaxID=153491 RepID=A0A376BT09_9NEIS|nr:tail protein X [Alysiella crassa]UOP08061.1 tail protein X [Alysiella crassa]SSY80137.1 Phage Tail Protein X [Alysiella crassa]
MNGVLIYTTRDGDRWDTISHKHYGTAFEINRLIAANPHLSLAEQFESGLTVFVPVIQQTSNQQQQDMPPWMR